MPEEETDTDNDNSAAQNPNEITIPCCSEMVHIAYRGRADDRLYMVYNRKWQEVRFFQQNGLKAFCAECRHRVL